MYLRMMNSQSLRSVGEVFYREGVTVLSCLIVLRRHAHTPVPKEQYKLGRLKQLKDANINLYTKFRPDCDVMSIRKKYDDLKGGDQAEGSYKIAGLVSKIRESGNKLKFVDLFCNGEKIQLKINTKNLTNPGSGADEVNLIRRGDRIGVEGSPCRTKAGELSLECSQVKILAPCLHPLPNNHLENTKKRFGRRYVDILLNPSIRDTLASRSSIIRFIRRYLEDRHFMEVETPILGSSVGGASATPFVTFHEEMKAKLYLRVAPELYLKQMIIAGFDRVFEIGKMFRNEGIDASHNPEFTSCEFYMAYADYNDLMHFTNHMLSNLVKEFGFQPRHGSVDVDFTADYKKLEFLPALESAVDCRLPDPDMLQSDESLKFLVELCRQRDIPVTGPLTVPRLLDKLASVLVEPNLVQPTFLTDHPMIMSPLSSPRPDNPHLAERFELYACATELCNAYTELNNPELQRSTFRFQAGLEDPESMLPDEGFCTALDHGLPPTAGWGCGLDRLTAILTNNHNIRETISFPLTKPVASKLSSTES